MKEGDPMKDGLWRQWWFWVILVAALVIFGSFFLVKDDGRETSESIVDMGNEIIYPNVPKKIGIGVGVEVSLDAGESNTMIALTEKVYDEMIRLSLNGDSLGLGQMESDGKLLVVEKGTKAKIVDIDFIKAKVRISSGNFLGKSGWVPMEFCHK